MSLTHDLPKTKQCCDNTPQFAVVLETPIGRHVMALCDDCYPKLSGCIVKEKKLSEVFVN